MMMHCCSSQRKPGLSPYGNACYSLSHTRYCCCAPLPLRTDSSITEIHFQLGNFKSALLERLKSRSLLHGHRALSHLHVSLLW